MLCVSSKSRTLNSYQYYHMFPTIVAAFGFGAGQEAVWRNTTIVCDAQWREECALASCYRSKAGPEECAPASPGRELPERQHTKADRPQNLSPEPDLRTFLSIVSAGLHQHQH